MDAQQPSPSSRDRLPLAITPAQIIAARAGHWSIVLTEQKPIPAAWFPQVMRRSFLTAPVPV